MPEALIFAVGDIHGRLDLLSAALKVIQDRASRHEVRIVFLGDYVDRGPSASGVVTALVRLSQHPMVVCLKGNHEAMMLNALRNEDEDAFEHWMAAGGEATVASYGATDYASALALTPTSHLHWMDGLPLTWGDEHRLYVHAGLMPGTPFERQTEETFLWVRERFLRAPGRKFEKHVVHGHTPVWAGKPVAGEPELLSHRTNLDLAAYATDRLGVGVFQADRPGGPVEVLIVSNDEHQGISVASLKVDPMAARHPRLAGEIFAASVKTSARLR